MEATNKRSKTIQNPLRPYLPTLYTAWLIAKQNRQIDQNIRIGRGPRPGEKITFLYWDEL